LGSNITYVLFLLANHVPNFKKILLYCYAKFDLIDKPNDIHGIKFQMYSEEGKFASSFCLRIGRGKIHLLEVIVVEMTCYVTLM
jgi:hypothetical protein